MYFSMRSRLALTLLALSTTLAACGEDSPGITDPGATAPTALTVTALSSTRTQVSFTGRGGDDRYLIERAPAGSTTFAQVGTVNGTAAGGTLTYTDSVGLLASTDYQYRAATVRGSATSAFTAPATVRTLAPGRATTEITQDIVANRTFYPDTTYVLKGFIHVANGATLTILPGTRIVGDYETVGSSLFVLRGAKINAVGTAELPIVFTSERPAGQRRSGDWGGLILIGNGIVNRTGDIEIEGTGTVTGTASGTNYKVIYSGGTTNDDDSGELRYVRVEFAGYGPSLNNELNSFTFGAIGSRTRLSYLQSVSGLDDSFEWFGGNVDATHLVSYEAGDDHFDMSEGYSGRLQYLIAYQDTVLPPRELAGVPSSDPQGIENDGCSGTGCTNGFASTPYTAPVVANFTLVGTGKTALSGSSGGYGMVLRRGTAGHYVNGVIARWARGGVGLRDSVTYARAGSVATPDMATAELAIRNVVFAETGTSVFQGGTGNFAFDLAANSLVTATTTASLFTTFPADATGSTTASAFDWTPPAGSAAATGGMTSFTGVLGTRAGTAVTPTSFVGAAPPAGSANARWWAGWTVYAQN